MKLRLLYHGHCFDGVASAAIFTRFYKERINPEAEVNYCGLLHRPGNLFDRSLFDGDENAIVDFKYAATDKVTWWFDHHDSAFLTPEDETHFRNDQSGKKFFDPTRKSCAEFIAEVARTRFGFDDRPLESLIHWAHIVDGALYDSPAQCVELKEPALQLMQLIEAEPDDNFIEEIIRELTVRPLDEVATSERVQERFQPIFKHHQETLEAIRSKAVFANDVVRFDLVDEGYEAFNKFIPYYLYPETTYSVALTRGPVRTKISVGSNPWAPRPRTHNIAKICEQYGGGGHAVVGAISLGPEEVAEAREILNEIVAELSVDRQNGLAEAKRRIRNARKSSATELDLQMLGLKQLPKTVGQIKSLERLNLNGNNLPSVPSFLRELTHLRRLVLNKNPLSVLPKSLTELTNLRELRLEHCGLTEFPEWIGDLTQLERLYLGGNKLVELPNSIANLKSLQTLDVRDNVLESLPDGISKLEQMQSLYLQGNRLKGLPASLENLSTLKALYLEGNDLLGLPPEIVQHRSEPNVILNYYFQARQGAQPLREGKLILLGHAMTGKTTLVHRLASDRYREEPGTHGFSITELPAKVDGAPARLHVWDFGGQEILHGAHRFFLSTEAVYLIVVTGRGGTQDKDAEYWLQMVELYGNSSPAIVILNQVDVVPFAIDRPTLQEKFPFIQASVETSSKTGQGLERLRDEINFALGSLKGFGSVFPKKWLEIRERLMQSREDFISFRDYRRICADSGENGAAEQEALASTLNALGLTLTFKNEAQQFDFLVLNPPWIADAFYMIISSPELVRGRGEFRLKDLSRILRKELYPPRTHRFIVSLMERAELCFPLKSDKSGPYLIPQLLPIEEPALTETSSSEAGLGIRFDYQIMPEGLLPLFITRTHTMSEPDERWRTGVVLRLSGTSALITADIERRQVLVLLNGEPGWPVLSALILKSFERIHSDLKQHKPITSFAVPNHADLWVSREELEVRLQHGEQVMTIAVGKELLSLNVQDLLSVYRLPQQDVEISSETLTQAPLKVMISYGDEDSLWLGQIHEVITALQGQGVVDVLGDSEVNSGVASQERARRFEQADVYLFLVSDDLLLSEYFLREELPVARKRAQDRKAVVMPIIVRDCKWHQYFGHFDVLPSDFRPLDKWRDKNEALLEIAAGLRKAAQDFQRPDVVSPSGYIAADAFEQVARDHLKIARYEETLGSLEAAIREDPSREQRVRAEFGFLFNSIASEEKFADVSPETLSRVEWCRSIWQVLSERNSFPLADRQADTAELEVDTEAFEPEVVAPTIKPQTETAEQKGDQLEEAVARLFRVFFQIGDDLPWKIRKQNRGTQGGFDLSIEWSGTFEVAGNASVRCHIECKNYKEQITLREVGEKLLSEPRRNPVIEHWILISPRSNPSNPLNDFLEKQRDEGTFPFDVQVWCPETGIEELFSLEPDVYDRYFEPRDGEQHPRLWDDERREAVRAKWRRKLEPPLRVPQGWREYLENPDLLCIHQEKPAGLDATYLSHVRMPCRNSAGALLEKPLEEYVDEWLAAPDPQVLFLLGEFGDGKSFFTYALARRLVADWNPRSVQSWIPLRLALRIFPGNPRDFLRNRLETFNTTVGGWQDIGKISRRLVILDGFDEMSVDLDPATITKNIKALLACLDEFRDCKVLITSRTHFFHNRKDAQRLVTRAGAAPIYYLAPIGRSQVVGNIAEAVSGIQKKALLQQLETMNDPIGLASKPLFLEMLKQVLGAQDLPAGFDTITLYERYIDLSLTRKQELLDDPDLSLPPSEIVANLKGLLGMIAVQLQRHGDDYVLLRQLSIDLKEPFAQLLWKLSGPDVLSEDAEIRVGARSLLGRVIRPDLTEEWPVDFCHRSMREYFVAVRLCEAVQAGVESGTEFLQTVPLNHEILEFAAERWRRTAGDSVKDNLLELIKSAVLSSQPGRLGGYALTLLYRVAPELPRTFSWKEKVFDGADLENADLSDLDFRGSSFRHANLANVNFEGANFECCDLTGVRLEETAPVLALAREPSGEHLVAVYRDGVLRQWHLKPGSRTPSRVLGKRTVEPGCMVGVHESGQPWLNNGRQWRFFVREDDGGWSPSGNFNIKESFNAVRSQSSILVLSEKDRNGGIRIAVVDLDRQEKLCSTETNATRHFATLGSQAMIWSDAQVGFRVRSLLSENKPDLILPCDEPTCLDIFQLRKGSYLVGSGTGHGIVHAWKVCIQDATPAQEKVLEARVHEGVVTAVAFVDDSRLSSGGSDCAIVISRWLQNGDINGKIERRLQLRMRCRGLKIEGLKGDNENALLARMIQEAERR